MKQPSTYRQIERFMHRPAEQLYHTLEDSYEMQNLVEDEGYAEIKSRLSGALDAWMEAEGDPGAEVDTIEALQASRKGQHLHGKP